MAEEIQATPSKTSSGTGKIVTNGADPRLPIFQRLLAELSAFDAEFKRVRQAVTALPPPLNGLPIVSLRHAEELRHGSDHIVVALRDVSNDELAREQLRDARSHLENLLPDLYMHVNGYLLRYCADAISEVGMAGKLPTEEQALEDLIQAYGEARMLRTGERDQAIERSRTIFQKLCLLTPTIMQATTEDLEKQEGQMRHARRLAGLTFQEIAFAIFGLGIGIIVWLF